MTEQQKISITAPIEKMETESEKYIMDIMQYYIQSTSDAKYEYVRYGPNGRQPLEMPRPPLNWVTYSGGWVQANAAPKLHEEPEDDGWNEYV